MSAPLAVEQLSAKFDHKAINLKNVQELLENNSQAAQDELVVMVQRQIKDRERRLEQDVSTSTINWRCRHLHSSVFKNVICVEQELVRRHGPRRQARGGPGPVHFHLPTASQQRKLPARLFMLLCRLAGSVPRSRKLEPRPLRRPSTPKTPSPTR